MNTIISIPISELSEEREQPSLTYALDLDKGRIMGKVDGLEAVNQFIRKTLITPRFSCLIYDNQHGSEIKNAVAAKDASREYIESELPRLIEDALSNDGRILNIYDFDLSFSDDEAFVRFKVDTVFGTSVMEVAI